MYPATSLHPATLLIKCTDLRTNSCFALKQTDDYCYQVLDPKHLTDNRPGPEFGVWKDVTVLMSD